MLRSTFSPLIFLILFLIPSIHLKAQSNITLYRDSIVLSNAFLSRNLDLTGNGIATTKYINLKTGQNYTAKGSEEFSVKVNGYRITGADIYNFLILGPISVDSMQTGCKKLTVSLTGLPDKWAANLVLNLEYRIYDDHPVIRKFIHIENRSDADIYITDLDVENLQLLAVSEYMTNVYANYGTSLYRIPYTGDYYDAALLVYNENEQEGFILGNEAPSVLKKTDIYPVEEKITIGMKHLGDDYPFKKFLKPGEKFSSPGTFICFFDGPKWQEAFEGPLADFTRDHFGTRLFERDSYPLFYYCTWNPFRTNINERLVTELADALDSTGVEVLILDDGWQDNRGDWNPDKEKFPNGLLRVCEHIRSKGIKPGMWFTIATIDSSSRIYHEHPEWAIRDSSGNPVDIHSPGWENHVSMSMCSGWYDYILEKLSLYVGALKLGYVKLDFATAVSAYVMDPAVSGDYHFDGKGYPDHESSHYAIFEATIKLLDELHNRHPNLIIDCTFEVWGRYNISDFALIQHADVSWLTNYEFPPPRGPISIRQVLGERANVIPPATMLIGNQLMISDNHEFAYQSVASSVQLLCGDVRGITPEQKQWYKKWTDWYHEMEDKYSYTRFYQKSDMFNKPTLNNWDGCYKINPGKEGGILFFYRNNSPDEIRTFRVHCVNDATTYSVYDPMTKVEIGRFSGLELREEGIKIQIDSINTAKVLGIELID
ncbi:MAG: alpha-galactosidase [Bacteroidales bacterium]|nr:alpha-galactosidase [Bacteroidales bacterium]